MTLEQVGEVLGVTRERVRQIEAVAMKKLRDGIGLAEAVTVDGVTVAVVICERCDLYYPREGRSKICADCADPPDRRRRRRSRNPRTPRRRISAVPPPVVQVVDVTVLEVPEPAPEPGFSLSLIFDFSNL